MGAMNLAPVVVAYGAGTNSVAMLVDMHAHGERPDLILFANTGNELKRIYAHLEIMREWCARVGFPDIVTVVKGGRQETLYENCIRMQMLPSIAYGFKSCSHKFKREPQDKFCNNWGPARLAWESGLKVIKLIGYDTDEEHRAKIPEDDKYRYRYPHIERGRSRDDCVALIRAAGLPLPGGSACTFCPSSTREEIDELKFVEPEAFRAALAMERNADGNLDSIAGLGRRFSWHEHSDDPADLTYAAAQKARYDRGREVAAWNKRQDPRQQSLIEIDCGCYDGERLPDAAPLAAKGTTP
jgi:hypothetical protein